MFQKLMNDEAGFLVSAELVLVFTLVFCGVAVGMAVVRDALVQELGDVSEAIGAVNQSYGYRSISAPDAVGGTHGTCSGSGFFDQKDDCDCDGIDFIIVNPKNDPNNTAGPGQAGEGQ